MSIQSDAAGAPAAGGDPVSIHDTRQPAATARKVASPRKVAANRANAARSTGPRTPEGRARAAMNAVRHGLAAQASLLPGEDPGELEALARAYEADLRPRGALERDLVGRIVAASWRLRRLARAEEAAWQREDDALVSRTRINRHVLDQFGMRGMPWVDDDDAAGDAPPPPASAAAFVATEYARRDTSILERLAAHEQRLDRALHAAAREFKALRLLRGAGMDYGEDGRPDEVTAAAVAAAAGDGPDRRVAETAPAPAAAAQRPAKPQATAAADGGAGDPGCREGAHAQPAPPAAAPSSPGVEQTVRQNEPTVGIGRAPDPSTLARTASNPQPEGTIGHILQNEATAGSAPAGELDGAGLVPDGTIGHMAQNEPAERPLWTRTPTGFSPR